MDCVVMKVPSSVTDESMRKLGELKMTIDSSKTYGELNMTFVDSSARGNARIVSDTAYFTNSAHDTNKGKEVQEGHLYTSSGDGGYIFLGNKQNIKALEIQSGALLNLEELKFCTGLQNITTRDNCAEGDIANLSSVAGNMTRVDIRTTNNVFGSLDVFAGATNLVIVFLERTKCTGSIENFGSCTAMTQLYVYDSTLVTGDPDDLADLMVAAGRTSGTLQFTSVQRVVTTYTFSENGWTKS